MIHRSCLRALAPGGLLVARLLIAPAAGASPASEDDATSQRIAALFKRANVLYDNKRLAEAEPLYMEAWKLRKTYDVAGNLGVVEVKLGKYPQAAEHLTWALSHFPLTDTAKARRGFEQELEKARAQSGALRIRVSVDGAEVSVNGRPVGAAPLADEVFVEPGVASVGARREGYTSAQQAVTVAKGVGREVVLTLAPVEVERRSMVPGAVLGAVAGAALVTGAVLEAVGASQRSSVATTSASILNEHHSCVPNAGNYDARCPSVIDMGHSSDTLHNAGIGVLVGAGALAVGSVAYFLWPASRPGAASRLRAVPLVSTTGAALSFSGSF